MDDSADEADNNCPELDLESREKLIDNEMRSFKNRGFHDGYDEGKKATAQDAFDSGYQKAFEQNFILSTLRGVAQALKSSYNLNNQTTSGSRPTSTTSTGSTASSSCSATSSSSPLNNRSTPINQKNRSRMRTNMFGSSTRFSLGNKTTTTDDLINCSSNSSSSSSITTNLSLGSSSVITSTGAERGGSSIGNDDGKDRNSTHNNHLLLLESMKFDNVQDIDSIKKDLIKICHENRLEILAHYISHIG